MRTSRFFRRYAAGAFVVGGALLIGGVANAASPASTLMVTAAPTPTSTTLTVSPASPVAEGTRVTLTAAVTPVEAAGNMEFRDGTTNIGPSVPVTNGAASGTTSTLTAGSHQLTAVFTPTDLAAFSPSKSPPVTFVVTAPAGATPTSTALTASPTSPVAQGTPVTLTAAVTPAEAPGTVQFKDGTTNIGTPLTITNGAASVTTSTLAAGSHQLTAVFTPTDSTAFSPSTSPAVSLTVTELGG